MVKDQAWYNREFQRDSTMFCPPEQSPLYPMWKHILSHHLKVGWRILDVGCTAGGFARLCVDRGFSYVGVDWAEEAVKLAGKRVPEAVFHVADVAEDQSLLRKGEYDAATFIEFFEHVDDDLKILNAVPTGKQVVVSVPNWLGAEHVRCFKTAGEVYSRYVDGLLENPSGVCSMPTGYQQFRIFIVSGVKR